LSAIATNVAGSAQVAQAFEPLLSKSPNPRIIFMSSGLGSLTRNADTGFHKNWPAYSASKAALNSIMIWFSQKHPDWKINACCPGFRATALNNYGESTKNVPGKLEDSAINAVRLTLLDKDGETGTFTQRNDDTGEIRILPW
jgi:NAD(P)-dependent dehydrogenase (short-subunit alcohol dehydrogenase family)